MKIRAKIFDRIIGDILIRSILYPTNSLIGKCIIYICAGLCSFYIHFRSEIKSEIFKFMLWSSTIFLVLAVTGHLPWYWLCFLMLWFCVVYLPFGCCLIFFEAEERATKTIIKYFSTNACEHNKETNIVLRSKIRKRLYTTQERLNMYFQGIEKLRDKEKDENEDIDLVSKMLKLSNQDRIYILQGKGKNY